MCVQVRPRAGGGRVLRRRRGRRRPSARQLRRGAREHGRVSGVEARRDGRAGHAAPGADDRGRRGRGADPDRAAAAVLGAVLPRRVRLVLLKVRRLLCTCVSGVQGGSSVCVCLSICLSLSPCLSLSLLCLSVSLSLARAFSHYLSCVHKS